MKRMRTGTVTVDVDVDTSEVLDQVDDEELLDELEERGLTAREPGSSALMVAIEAEHQDCHPGGPLWLCREGICARINHHQD